MEASNISLWSNLNVVLQDEVQQIDLKSGSSYEDISRRGFLWTLTLCN